MQAMLTGILSETESEFDRVARDMRFYAQLEEEQNMIESYVNESIILASGNKRAINEMVILHEAALGDKIKGFFTKIKNFFKKIFDKLGAALNGVIIEQKKYIERYQFIITKCKYQAGDINDVYDHFVGISRIIDAADNADTAILGKNMDRYCESGTNDDRLIKLDDYNTADKIMSIDIEKSMPVIKPEEQKAKSFEEFTASGSYWADINGFKKENDANGNPDPTATFKAYFNGSYDTVSWSVDKVEDNMNTIINTVYAGQSYMTKLEKIVSSVNKKTDEMQKKMEDYYKAQRDKIVSSAKTPAQTANQDAAAAAVEDAKKNGNKAAAAVDSTPTGDNSTAAEQPAGQTKQNASYEYTSGTPVVEMNITNGSSNNNNDNKGDSKAGAGVSQINSASKGNEKVQSQTVKNQQAKDHTINRDGNSASDDQLSKKAEEVLTRDINNRQALVNADIMISTTIANQMFAAFKLTNSDFFEIIKAHVQWYLGNPGSEKQTDNAANRPRNLDMNATVPGVTKGQATSNT